MTTTLLAQLLEVEVAGSAAGLEERHTKTTMLLARLQLLEVEVVASAAGLEESHTTMTLLARLQLLEVEVAASAAGLEESHTTMTLLARLQLLEVEVAASAAGLEESHTKMTLSRLRSNNLHHSLRLLMLQSLHQDTLHLPCQDTLHLICQDTLHPPLRVQWFVLRPNRRPNNQPQSSWTTLRLGPVWEAGATGDLYC
ncbi:MAG: hypothetical protein KVP17_003896 [Porospora cf. gigantea B]|uniref:uncharacterized protein n=1 Tax=Porospora cf. gigantea B TaxID=2853592 RepID=UPI003571E0A0|nr:MAG: hypothetical protein KVP17_003896 [Porospora cf. gigantea B]